MVFQKGPAYNKNEWFISAWLDNLVVENFLSYQILPNDWKHLSNGKLVGQGLCLFFDVGGKCLVNIALAFIKKVAFFKTLYIFSGKSVTKHSKYGLLL
jgi:hypothetical protein